jgi:hypothetical protein
VSLAALVHSDCADELTQRLNSLGLPEGYQGAAQPLAAGRSALIACESCTACGLPGHVLVIHQVAGEYVVCPVTVPGQVS